MAKKATGIPSIDWAQGVECALCFGWIDGQRDRDPDPGYFRQRFTPRRKRSRWSKVNREKVAALIDAGLMTEAGIAEVERAQADGRWEAAYDAQSTAAVPDDLRAALDAQPAAAEAFAGLDSRNRYAILYRVGDAKRPATREKRIATFVAMLARGERLHP
ncbi:MAG: hypothetical protein QOE86_2095 [Solirubrobacteraceae bacterium]|jgi:uncharacterized protein YdeI (YjbR/CyaY-like superfamily)|nr:hypothetical protein [Solirubrobacteraceae bacterium]